MQQLFDILSNIIVITGNHNIDKVLLWIIGVVSFLISFDIVGWLFRLFGIFDSKLMSDCHWFFRILLFVGLSVLMIYIFKAIKWLFSYKWWIYLIVFTVVGFIVFLIYYFKWKKKKNEQLNKTSNKQN